MHKNILKSIIDTLCNHLGNTRSHRLVSDVLSGMYHDVQLTSFEDVKNFMTSKPRADQVSLLEKIKKSLEKEISCRTGVSANTKHEPVGESISCCQPKQCKTWTDPEQNTLYCQIRRDFGIPPSWDPKNTISRLQRTQKNFVKKFKHCRWSRLRLTVLNFKRDRLSRLRQNAVREV